MLDSLLVPCLNSDQALNSLFMLVLRQITCILGIGGPKIGSASGVLARDTRSQLSSLSSPLS